MVKELIDAGMDVNARDFDREDTALHMAAAKGQKEVIEILVANGANVNAQNNRGQTPLHSLVKKRFDLLALWLVRQGADINLEDDKNCSARDFALNWFQQELDGIFLEFFLKKKKTESLNLYRGCKWCFARGCCTSTGGLGSGTFASRGRRCRSKYDSRHYGSWNVESNEHWRCCFVFRKKKTMLFSLFIFRNDKQILMFRLVVLRR